MNVKLSSILLLVIGAWVAVWMSIFHAKLWVNIVVCLVAGLLILWRDEIKRLERGEGNDVS